MKEQNGNEKGTGENKPKPKKWKWKMSGEKRFYLFTAIGCAAVLLAVIIIAVAVTNSDVDIQAGVNNSASSTVDSEESSDVTQNSGNAEDVGGSEDGTVDEPVVNTPEGMVTPLDSVTVSNDYGFFYNQTLNSYYEHQGVDFVAAAGTEVQAVEAGTIESIYKDDLLLGTEITIDHGDGLKSVYRFVTEKEGLTVGVKVEKGEVIATVAEATGEEYKDGAHLHFEIIKNGVNVDPSTYLTLDEK